MRRGVSLAEIVLAVGLLAIVGVPLLGVLATTDHEAMTSQDYMQAEAVAQRELALVLAMRWDDLDRQLPLTRPVRGGDPELAGELTATRLEDGLISISVELAWAVHTGSAAQRRYGLVRFVARPDQSIRTAYPFGDGEAKR